MWFWIDLVSTIPWEALELTSRNSGVRGAGGTALKVPKLLRLLRLTKLLKILRAMQLFQRWEHMIVKHVRLNWRQGPRSLPPRCGDAKS